MPPSWRRSLIGCLLIALSALLFGCIASDRSSPELLTVTELVPHSAGLGDRVEVLGRNLPVGRVDDVRVFFRGRLARAGQPALHNQVVEVAGARLERDRVSFELDERTLERFVGPAFEARHTTFVGRVEVVLTGASKTPVHGSIKGDVTFDVMPREIGRALRERRIEEAREAAAFFGLDLAPETAGEGLDVRAVRPDSPGARAGIREGDRLLALGGVSTLDPTDIVPDARGSSVPLSLERDGARVEGAISIEGYRGDQTSALGPGVIVLASLLITLLLLGTGSGRWLSWLSHRLDEGVLRHRRPGGSFSAALLRAALHDARRGPREDGALSAILPVIVFVGVSVTFASLPFLEMNGRAELDIGILYLLSVTSLLVMGLLTGGWASSESPVWGRLRAVLDVVVCELPALSALLAVVLTTGSLRVRDVVVLQMGSRATWSELGGVPWAWNALKSPHLFLLFALFFVSALIDGSKTKTLAAADSTRQRGGLPLGSAAFFFAEWMHLFVMCALATVAFLGGYGVPGVSAAELGRSTGWQIAGAVLFLVKCWSLVGFALVARATLPRLRPRTVLRLGLRVILPACALGLGLTALSLRFPLMPGVERALGMVTLATVLTIIGLVVGSVARGSSFDQRSTDGSRSHEGDLRFRARVNPLL
jgi:NADH-quinone oxidoreductase subunit H